MDQGGDVKRVAGTVVALGFAWISIALVPVTYATPSIGLSQPTSPAPTTTGATTGPGLGKKSGRDAVSARAVRGIAFIAVALVVVGWLFRLRVRDWMLGRQKTPPDPPDLGADGRAR